MKFVFRRPQLPCVAIANEHAYAVYKPNHFDKVIKADKAKSVHFLDAQGMRYDYHPDMGLIVPGFPMQQFSKKQIIEAVFGCANMKNRESRIRTRNLSNIRLEEVLSELCRAIEEARL